MANEDPHSYFLTPEGTCYHGRMVSGGRAGDAGPLALKRELRQHETEAARLERSANEKQVQLTYIENEIAAGEQHVTQAIAQQMEAEKSLVAATHQRDQSRAELRRIELQFSSEREEISRLHAAGRSRAAARGRSAHRSCRGPALPRVRRNWKHGRQREALQLRNDFQAMQENVVAAPRRAGHHVRAADQRRIRRTPPGRGNFTGLRTRALASRPARRDRSKNSPASKRPARQLAVQAEELRKEKSRLEENKAALDAEWEIARSRAAHLDEELRGKRTSLEELRAERSQHQIEKARNDADRDYLRQTCVTELNAQPEELIALQQGQLLVGEDLIAAETNYNEMKARVDAMGPVNMMALEEFQECEQRDTFLRRERDDLVIPSRTRSSPSTNSTTSPSRNSRKRSTSSTPTSPSPLSSLFGGGHGEMRLGEPDSSGEMGIDIVAQPPGKRLQNILLLSGGEKALTALALLIAVFKYSPSPFCILDEVDAPLDEANVGRFNRMLARYVRADAVHRGHPQPQNHGNGFGDVRRDHARARRFQAGLGEVGRSARRSRRLKPPATQRRQNRILQHDSAIGERLFQPSSFFLNG